MALDNRLPKPVLSDAMADEIVRELDYPFEQFKVNKNFILNVHSEPRSSMRWRQGSFATIQMRWGLTWAPGWTLRVVRIAAPATVDWYDVDYPAVVALRERVIPDRVNAHNIGADVTDAEWLNNVPTDRPAVIVADGLMGFLTKEDWVSLMNRLISHFPSGEMAFNSYTPFAVWASEHVPGTKSVSGLLKFPGVNDPGNSKLESETETDQGNPAHPGTRDRRVSNRRPPLHPVLGDQHNLVPEGDHRFALPLLGTFRFKERS